MLDDIRRRLDDLTATAIDLSALLATGPAGRFPGMLLARAALEVDNSAAALERHLASLRTAFPGQGPPGGA